MTPNPAPGWLRRLRCPADRNATPPAGQWAGAGQLPPDFPLDELGVTAQDVTDVLDAQIIDVQDASVMIGHFDDVLAVNGLVRVVPEELAV